MLDGGWSAGGRPARDESRNHDLAARTTGGRPPTRQVQQVPVFHFEQGRSQHDIARRCSIARRTVALVLERPACRRARPPWTTATATPWTGALAVVAYRTLRIQCEHWLCGRWRSAQPQRLRLQLFRLPAKLTTHARETCLQLLRDEPGPGGSATLDENTDRPMAILREPDTGQVRGFVSRPLDAGSAQAPANGAATTTPDIEELFSRGMPVGDAWRWYARQHRSLSMWSRHILAPVAGFLATVHLASPRRDGDTDSEPVPAERSRRAASQEGNPFGRAPLRSRLIAHGAQATRPASRDPTRYWSRPGCAVKPSVVQAFPDGAGLLP